MGGPSEMIWRFLGWGFGWRGLLRGLTGPFWVKVGFETAGSTGFGALRLRSLRLPRHSVANLKIGPGPQSLGVNCGFRTQDRLNIRGGIGGGWMLRSQLES